MIEAPPVIVFVGGLVIIILGAEVLLRSATTIATMLGISPIVIGLTCAGCRYGDRCPRSSDALCPGSMLEGRSACR